MATVHPALQEEQAYVDNAYRLLDRGLADAEREYATYEPRDRATKQAMQRALQILQGAKGYKQLVAGRIDDADGFPLYIGRRLVKDEQREVVVMGWHAPAAAPFFEADPTDPRGLTLKRVFVEEDRRLRRIIDEIVVDAARGAVDDTGQSVISDALLQELERSREGAMREVVATIQAEQYRIIRADLDSVLVVQGGPGTGKTVVGLHRAAWLAFNHQEVRRQGMLVVAPSTAFLSYISGVLPSLDVTDVQQIDVGSVYVGEATRGGDDDPDTARVKGSAEMAAVLRRALKSRVGWDGGDLELSLGASRFAVPADDIRAMVAETQRRQLPHNEARDILRASFASLAFRHYVEDQQRLGRLPAANEPTLRRLTAFTNALDRMWPTFTPEDFLRTLYGTQSWLVEASTGVLTADDRARLYRAPQRGIADEPWTPADLICLDELSHLLNGDVVTYGHVVVDEAQDLSPMQARALARRCPSGSFTVLGDLAQATGPWIRDSWEELAEHLASTQINVETLTIGYRVPAPVLDLASRQLPLISPGLEAPRSIRSGLGVPSVARVGADELVAEAFRRALACVDAGMTTAVVLPDALYDEVMDAAEDLDVAWGDGREGDFSAPLTLVPASLSKALEFDAVILAGPDQIVDTTNQGRRLLYVAMTRCTQQLTIVHSAALPTGLDDLDPPDEGSDIQPDEEEAPIERTPDLADLVALLDDEDRAMVEHLVRRLLHRARIAVPEEDLT